MFILYPLRNRISACVTTRNLVIFSVDILFISPYDVIDLAVKMRDVINPTVFTMLFILFTGFYGFVKFSFENDHTTQVEAAINSKVLAHEVPGTSPSVGHDGVGLETSHPMSVAVHQNALTDSHRLLITYDYTESQYSRENLMLFLKNGLHSNADFMFILNGPTNVVELIPNKANIQVISEPSNYFDFDIYNGIVRENALWKNYNYFIVLDSRIPGPFMPCWSRSCWSDIFLSRLDEDIKLVAMTAKCRPKFHIQPMIWATDAIGMSLLLHPPKADVLYDDNQAVASGGSFANKRHAAYDDIKAIDIIKKAGYKVDALIATSHRSDNYE
ncbi:hypothetical protein F5Y04DRAFT_251686 [Hypomontagnella monticulosa]|nr:hypothetical protein F5Y04DRAFT_251686 [Hypomontagnella monticulosa]